MAKHAVEHAALAVLVHEGHRVVLAVDFRPGLCQDVDRAVAIEAGVQFVGRLERSEPLRDRVIGIGNHDGELAVRVVGPQRGIVDAAGDLPEFGPALERSAREVHQDQPLPFLDELLEVGPGLWAGVGRFPVHVVEHDGVVVVETGRREEVRVVLYLRYEPPVLGQEPGQKRCRLLPVVARVLVAREHQHPGLRRGPSVSGGRPQAGEQADNCHQARCHQRLSHRGLPLGMTACADHRILVVPGTAQTG